MFIINYLSFSQLSKVVTNVLRRLNNYICVDGRCVLHSDNYSTLSEDIKLLVNKVRALQSPNFVVTTAAIIITITADNANNLLELKIKYCYDIKRIRTCITNNSNFCSYHSRI